MKAKCIRDCFDNKTATLFRTTGGPRADGVYDIDPSAIYSPHFKFEDAEAQKTSDAVAARLAAEKAKREEGFKGKEAAKLQEELSETQAKVARLAKASPSVPEEKPDLQAELEKARAENARLKRNG